MKTAATDNDPLIDIRNRTTKLNACPHHQAGEYVLCWLQQTLRADDNPVIDAALAYANKRNLPVVVYHGMRQDYPHASDRLHYFLLGGSRDLQKGCDKRGIRMVSYLETPDNLEKGLVYRLAESAQAVFAEDHPSFVARWQTQRFAARVNRAVYAVDAARLVPSRRLPTGLNTTPAFRAANQALRDSYAAGAADFAANTDAYTGDLGFTDSDLRETSDQQLKTRIARCDIDHSLWPCDEFPPTRHAALSRLQHFITAHLPRYKWTRNNPTLAGAGAYLSPYLHFGLLGPRELYTAVQAADVVAAAKWKFLDEAITWREWFHYQALHTEQFECFSALPKPAKATLLTHKDDVRDTLYTLDELVHGQTHDALWNAAQKQWLATGYMHNNLRMYWSKQIIGWTPDPETAWNTACYINDRLSLDGRDPATYGNMQWCFGRAKPGYKEIEVYGWVAPKSSGALLKRTGVADWIEEMTALTVPRINVDADALQNRHQATLASIENIRNDNSRLI